MQAVIEQDEAVKMLREVVDEVASPSHWERAGYHFKVRSVGKKVVQVSFKPEDLTAIEVDLDRNVTTLFERDGSVSHTEVFPSLDSLRVKWSNCVRRAYAQGVLGPDVVIATHEQFVDLVRSTVTKTLAMLMARPSSCDDPNCKVCHPDGQSEPDPDETVH